MNRKKHSNAQQDHARHICTLDDPEKSKPYWDRTLWRALCSACAIWANNPYTKFYFRSLAAIERERRRHREWRGMRVIHPLSMFRFLWDIALMLLIYFGLWIVPLNFLFGSKDENGNMHFGHSTAAEALEIFGDVSFGIDVAMTFFTGYCVFKTKEIHLDMRRIARLYVSTFGFYLDVISCVSVVGIMNIYFHTNADHDNGKWVNCVKFFSMLKIFRLRRCLEYLNRLCEMMRRNYYYGLMLRYMFLTLLLTHWLTCIYISFTQNYRLYWWREDYYIYSYDHQLSVMINYSKIYSGAQRTVIHWLMNIGFVSGFYTHFDEDAYSMPRVILFIVYSLFGLIINSLIMILFIQMIISMNASEAKYHSILSQLMQYMRYKNLPNNMKDRIICYYDYRFQRKYFRESSIMGMLSTTLRHEIDLSSCRTLIETVSILRDLPPELISNVVTHLKHQVFLYDDVIVKAGTTGDCMYFIANGTVAVSTPTGREICHLQDGAYFGEIALISRDSKRIANVTAIEICEIYRLDRAHFRRCIDNNSTFHKKIEQVAQERMEKTLLLEELHKKYVSDSYGAKNKFATIK